MCCPLRGQWAVNSRQSTVICRYTAITDACLATYESDHLLLREYMMSGHHINNDSTNSEMRFSDVEAYWQTSSHSHLTKLVLAPEELTASGRYMGVRLDRMLVNVLVRNTIRDKEEYFSLLEVTISNLWEYRIRLYSNDQSMIDSEGFQHKLANYVPYEYAVGLQTGEFVKVRFDSPHWELESKSKTRGWIWFEPLAQNSLPHRFIFRLKIFNPGEISGHVEDTETIELVISKFVLHPVKLLS